MAVWIIFAVILLVLVLFLLIRLRLHIEKREAGIHIVLSILFWKIPLYPRPKRPEASEKEQAETTENKAGIRISEIPSALRRMADFLKRLAQILITKLLRNIVLEQLELWVAISTDDAAETALLYPKVSAGSYTVLALLEELITVRRYQVDIVPDFCHNKTRWSIKADFSLRVMHILAAGIAILILWLQNRHRLGHTLSDLKVKE